MSSINASPGYVEGVSLLLNALDYFLQLVYIAELPSESVYREKDYRLVVIHNNRVIFDRTYASYKAAKLGFYRRFRHKSWTDGAERIWSAFPFPGDGLLDILSYDFEACFPVRGVGCDLEGISVPGFLSAYEGCEPVIEEE